MIAGERWEGARLALAPGLQDALRQLGKDASFPQVWLGSLFLSRFIMDTQYSVSLRCTCL